MTPLISIIIPTFNRADLIGETLDSVLAQTYSNWECIIVDDGSTDNSIEVIQKYLISDARFIYFSRPEYKKKGPSSCRNFGLEKSNGEYIIFLDSDDLLADFCLENRIEFALANQDFDFWIFKMQTFGFIDVPIFEYGNCFYENENEFCRNQFAEGNHPFVVSCPLWKKVVLQNINGFNEDLTLYEDPELHLRVLKNGNQLKFANFENPDCFYRLIKNKKEVEVLIKLKNSFIFFKNHLNDNDSSSILYFKKVLNDLILKRVSVYQYLKFYRLGTKKNIFHKGNFIYGLIILIYHTIGLYKFRGFGYNYFKNQFNNF
jgi:glycosyltransferase involved in cell wall biosynthesis